MEEKSVFCCLGPNGAGKSTLVKILTGQLKAERGCAWLMQKDVGQFSSQISRMVVP
ncbi:MAG: ATP-binding cassette domain-containing protein [Proteobacteria bacterium]|nr:ATP-binding cassette domain-containing protein [Pseudomonadota bacterium]